MWERQKGGLSRVFFDDKYVFQNFGYAIKSGVKLYIKKKQKKIGFVIRAQIYQFEQSFTKIQQGSEQMMCEFSEN